MFECASEHLEEREHDDPEDEEGDRHHLLLIQKVQMSMITLSLIMLIMFMLSLIMLKIILLNMITLSLNMRNKFRLSLIGDWQVTQ